MRTIFKIVGFIQVVLFCYNYWFPTPRSYPGYVEACKGVEVAKGNLQTQKEIFSGPVEIMPLFPGCEDPTLSKSELKTCADQKLLDFVYSRLRYSKGKECAEGRVIVQFNIEKDGSITAPKIMRDIAPGFGEEVIRVIHLMPKFIPGTQNGRPVKVRYTLPVRFRLE